MQASVHLVLCIDCGPSGPVLHLVCSPSAPEGGVRIVKKASGS